MRISLFAFLMLFSVTMFGQFNAQTSYEVGVYDSITYTLSDPGDLVFITEVRWVLTGTSGTNVIGYVENDGLGSSIHFDYHDNISLSTFNDGSNNKLHFQFGDMAIFQQSIDIYVSYIDTSGNDQTKHDQQTLNVNVISKPTISGPSDIKRCCTDPVSYTASGYQKANVFAWTVTGGTILSGNGTNTIMVQPSINNPISVSCNVSRTQSVPAYNYTGQKTTTRSQVVTPPIEGEKYSCLGDVNEFALNLDDFCGNIASITWDIPDGFEHLGDITNGNLTSGVILQPIPNFLHQTLRITAQLIMANGCVATVSSHYVTVFDYATPPTPQGYIAVTTDPNPITDPCDDYALFFNFVGTNSFPSEWTTMTPSLFIGVPHHIRGNKTVDVQVCYYNPCPQVRSCTTFVVDLPAPCPDPRIANNPTTVESLTFKEGVNLEDGKQEEGVSESLKIYPNPTSGRLQIEYLQELPSIIRILDMSGKVAFETIAQQRNQTIDLTALPSGVYVVEIIGKEQIEKQLIVIQ